MHLTIVGDSYTENLRDELLALTNRARVNIDKITYDQEIREVVIPFTRYPVISGQKKIFRRVTPYDQEMNSPVSCTLTIRNVAHYQLDHQLEGEDGRTFTILFGVTVNNGEVYICSAEESLGNLLCEIRIMTGSLNLEIKDE